LVGCKFTANISKTPTIQVLLLLLLLLLSPHSPPLPQLIEGRAWAVGLRPKNSRTDCSQVRRAPALADLLADLHLHPHCVSLGPVVVFDATGVAIAIGSSSNHMAASLSFDSNEAQPQVSSSRSSRHLLNPPSLPPSLLPSFLPSLPPSNPPNCRCSGESWVASPLSRPLFQYPLRWRVPLQSTRPFTHMGAC
jgi:hypothetical protein